MDQMTPSAPGTAPAQSMPAEAERAPMQPQGDNQQASPEEQRQYDAFVAQALDLIYDQRMLPKIVDMLDGDGDPVEGLARATATIVARIATAAEKGGEKVSGDVLFHAGTEVFEDLANLSKTAKIKDYDADSDALEGAYFRAMDQFRVMMQGAGRINQQAAQEDMAKLEQMDQSGDLRNMFLSLAGNDGVEEAGSTTAPARNGLMRGAQ